MKLVVFTSFKGGCGKSTTLIAVASVLAEMGRRVALFEADDNTPLTIWRDNAQANGLWDEACTVYDAQSLDAFEASYEKAEADGCEIALIDTRGGNSELNQIILLNSSLTIIPSSLTYYEIHEALQSIRYVVELQKRIGAEHPVGLSLNRFPAGKLTLSEQDSLDALETVPCFDTRLGSRKAFADLGALGLLHMHHRNLLDTPGKRISASHTKVALQEAQALTDEILATLKAEEA
jgi:cellulose biosynthesis protein BcsQ